MTCLAIQINCAGLLKEKVNLAWNTRYITCTAHIRFGDTNSNSSLFQHHMPVIPNVQKELEDEYRKTFPAVKK